MIKTGGSAIRYLVAGLLGLLFMFPSVSGALTVGERAPLFHAESTQGTISLESYLGKNNVVLAFYFADFTPV